MQALCWHARRHHANVTEKLYQCMAGHAVFLHATEPNDVLFGSHIMTGDEAMAYRINRLLTSFSSLHRLDISKYSAAQGSKAGRTSQHAALEHALGGQRGSAGGGSIPVSGTDQAGSSHEHTRGRRRTRSLSAWRRSLPSFQRLLRWGAIIVGDEVHMRHQLRARSCGVMKTSSLPVCK